MRFTLLLTIGLLGGCASKQPCVEATPHSSEQNTSVDNIQEKAKDEHITRKSLTSLMEKTNYSVGVDMGRAIRENQLEYDQAIFIKGLSDGLSEDQATLLTAQEMTAVQQEYSRWLQEKRRNEKDKIAKENLHAGEQFLAKNKLKEGIVVLPSGLQYRILASGKGPKPTIEETVSVHYKGTLIDGTEFDSSYSRGMPLTIQLDRVIKGWTEALQLMPTGSKWELFVPSQLAYGERGISDRIGPNTVLIFEVELLEVK